MVQLSHPYMTIGKTIALTIWTFVRKMMSLLFSTLSRLVIAFLPKSKLLVDLNWGNHPRFRVGLIQSAGKPSGWNKGFLDEEEVLPVDSSFGSCRVFSCPSSQPTPQISDSSNQPYNHLSQFLAIHLLLVLLLLLNHIYRYRY